MRFIKLTATFALLFPYSALFVCNTASVANALSTFSGTLKVGKQYSYVYYFGKQSGDTVAYFFETNSVVGKKILSVCNDNAPCSGAASLEAVTSQPQGVPETTSGTYRMTSIADSDYKVIVENNTVCSFINANNVNVRQNPDIKSPVIANLNRGAQVRAMTRTQRWVKIAALESGKSYKPLSGYVFNQYINGCSEDQFDRWRK